MKDRRLGRGLDALISRTREPATGPSVAEVPLAEIRANPDQPRRAFDDQSLIGLATSIRNNGVLQPVIVQRTAGGYTLIAGERRVRAARLAERHTIPAMILEADGVSSLELALVENIQRENLRPLDEAAAYEALLARTGLTHEDLASRLGRSRPTITNALRLLELPDEIKVRLNRGELSAGQARALLAVKSPRQMLALADEAARKGLSVRDLERRAQTLRPSRKARPTPPEGPLEIRSYEAKLRNLYGTKATITGETRGAIELEFYSAEDRDRLLHLLLAERATTAVI